MMEHPAAGAQPGAGPDRAGSGYRQQRRTRTPGERIPAMPRLFINGAWRAASDGGGRDVVNPFDGSVVEQVDEATTADVADAVAAARAAFDAGPWPASTAAERAELLLRVADLLVADRERIARLETLDTGKTLAESRLDVDDVVAVFRYYAALSRS